MVVRQNRRVPSSKIPGRYKAEEKAPLDKHWQVYFLDKLAQTSNVSVAADCCGASLGRVYRLRRADPEFALKWRDALLEGYEHLELETLRRLREGVPPDGPKFDIPSALRLLALHKETVARERARIEHSDEASILASLNARLEAIRRNERAMKKIQARPSSANDAECGSGE